ncbi:MAG: glutamate---cysteine ligase / carboxylate-amine ligase, partial [Solirubrobacteraceae bacterium]|nr:glutamate---cysteine ligase / carboxylate-amine ligase [Solirubrobacteraceae bacterium]
EDTGYASYRGMVWERWPMAGMPPTYTSYDDYAAGAKLLVDTGTSADAGQVFWDVRPGTRYQTLEFRIADSCPTVDETVIQAGLARALVQTCLSEISRGSAAREARPELLRAAKWRAARFGLVASLLDPVCAEVLPAHALVERMLEYLRPALQLAGDWDELTCLLDRTRRDGSSAERQRRAHAEAGRLEDVVDLLAKETASL